MPFGPCAPALLAIAALCADSPWPPQAPQSGSHLPPSAYCIVTHHGGGPYEYPQMAAASQARYAKRHGYRHHAFVGRISGARFVDASRGPIDDLWGGGLFWQKVAAVQQVLNEGLRDEDGQRRRCEWVMWMDSDAVFSNQSVQLDTIIARWAPPPSGYGQLAKDILLSREDNHPINAGVFFIHNTDVGHAFIDALAALYPMYRENHTPEQTAMGTLAYVSEPWPSGFDVDGIKPEVHPHVAVVPQRVFNSFYGVDKTFGPNCQWQRCDFVAHFAGSPRWLRSDAMRRLLAEVDSCEDVARAPDLH